MTNTRFLAIAGVLLAGVVTWELALSAKEGGSGRFSTEAGQTNVKRNEIGAVQDKHNYRTSLYKGSYASASSLRGCAESKLAQDSNQQRY